MLLLLLTLTFMTDIDLPREIERDTLGALLVLLLLLLLIKLYWLFVEKEGPIGLIEEVSPIWLDRPIGLFVPIGLSQEVVLVSVCQ